MNQFFRPEANKNWNTFTWSLKAQIGNDATKPSDWPEGKISFAIEYSENGWKADSSVFDAALSLWMSHMQRKSTPSHLDWLRQRAGTEVQYLRVIGDNSNKIRERDLRWWVNDVLAEEIVKSDAAFSNRHNFGSMFVIGFQGLGIIMKMQGMAVLILLIPTPRQTTLLSKKKCRRLLYNAVGLYQMCLHNMCFPHLFGPLRLKSHTQNRIGPDSAIRKVFRSQHHRLLDFSKSPDTRADSLRASR